MTPTRFRFVLWACCCILFWKLHFLEYPMPERLRDAAADLCMFIWAMFLIHNIIRLIPLNKIHVLFYMTGIFLLFPMFMSTFFHQVFSLRGIVLQSFRPDLVKEFVTTMVPFEAWLKLGISMTAIVTLSYFKIPKLPQVSKLAISIPLIITTLLTSLWFFKYPRSSSMFPKFLGQLNRSDLFLKEVLVRGDGKGPAVDFDKSNGPLRLPVRTNIKKVLVFVLESVSGPDFAKAEKTNGVLSQFLSKIEKHSHRYNNYYTSNQDSRTADLAMLTSRFIPLEAYDKASLLAYSDRVPANTTVDAFNSMGFSTISALSRIENEIVIKDLAWKRKILLSKFPMEGFTCANPFKFEHSCEDLAIINEVLEEVKSNDKVFLFQHIIYGHSKEYIRQSNVAPMDYYFGYIEKVYAFLQKNDLLDETLLIFTSDHGTRLPSLLNRPENYSVPLFFINPSFTPKSFDNLYSHIDFRDLLFQEMSQQDPIPSDRPVFFIGPTGTNTVGFVSSDGIQNIFQYMGGKIIRIPASSSPEEERRSIDMAHAFNQYRQLYLHPANAKLK